MPELPITCALNPGELRARLARLLPALRERVLEVKELPDGLALRFMPTGELLDLLVHVIDAERQCCPFLRFRLTLEPEYGPVWLEVTGPGETREILCALSES